MEHERDRVADTDEFGSRRGGMADALGSGPSSFTGVWVQLPPTAPTYTVKNCGYGITAVHQPSKLVIGVRPPLPAPLKLWWDSRAAKGGRL